MENPQKTPIEETKKNPPQKNAENKKTHGFISNPGLPWVLCAILALGLVTSLIILDHEPRNRNSFGPGNQRSQMIIRHMDRGGDRDIRNTENQFRRMQQNISTMDSEGYRGEYSGTKIVDNISTTYSIIVGTGNINGTITSTDSGSLGSLAQSLGSLGFQVTENIGELTITGAETQTKNLLDLLGR